MDTATLIAPSDIDHLSRIRAQIVKDVGELKELMTGEYYLRGHYLGSVTPERVLLGYAVNSYHGHEIFKEGEEIEGLPVKFDRSGPNTITVCSKSRFKSVTW